MITMGTGGRISVLVSKDLQTLLTAVREIPGEYSKQIRTHTKKAAMPIWQDEVRGRVSTRLQTRVLSDTARVSVSDSNVMLKSAGIGKTSKGLPKSRLAKLAEFGNAPGTKVNQKSKKGKAYTRRMGRVSLPPRRGGYVVYPAAKDSIPRFASLWVQTGIRTIHEMLKKGGAR